ncbi:MAG: CheR family methyltransferase [Leptospirales bacterium]
MKLVFNDELYRNYAKLIYQKTGIVLNDNKQTMLSQRLRRRIKELRLHSFEEYWEYLKSAEGETSEMEYFLDAITTNETYFQRGDRHYKVLINHILPKLSSAGINNLTIWSCGTATGEEAYDLAMIAWDYMEKNPSVQIEIKATDLSGTALEFARYGEYADRKISKLTNYQREKFFSPVVQKSIRHPFARDLLQVKVFLKEIITFSKHNLVIEPYFSNVHILFCRNVMIYFDTQTRDRVVENFAHSLHPDGYLLVGHAESLHLLDTELKHIRYDNTTIYQRN